MQRKYKNPKDKKDEEENRRRILFLLIFFGFVLILVATITIVLVTIEPVSRTAIMMYRSNIFSVSNCSTFVNLTGTSTLTAAYLYVGIERNNTDSIQTPANNLPLFSENLLTVSFGIPLENGDVIINSFYTVSSRSSTLVSTISVKFFKTCLVNMTGQNICFNNGDFCRYPIELGELGSGIYLNNLQEVTNYVQLVTGSNEVMLDECSGCFNLLTNLSVTNVTNTIVVNPNAADNFITVVIPFIANFQYVPCLIGYTFGLTDSTETPMDVFVDFYINFGDGSPIQHVTGMYGDTNRFTYTYAFGVPMMVTVTINGYIPSWSCTTLYRTMTSYIPMSYNITQYGDIHATQMDFGGERFLLQMPYAQPPFSVVEMNYYFPFQVRPFPFGGMYDNVIDRIIDTTNFESWDMSRVTKIIGMFSGRGSGFPLVTLNIGHWNVSSCQMFNNMFFSNQITVNVTLWDTRSMYNANSMFYAIIQPLDISNFNTGNLRIARKMFQYADNQNNLDVSKWNTQNLQDITNMFMAIGGTAWNQPQTRPMFNNWYLGTITQCDYFIQSGMQFFRPTIYDTNQYDLILNSFYYNASNSLICNWGLNPADIIQAQYSNASATNRAALITRGWLIADLGLAP